MAQLYQYNLKLDPEGLPHLVAEPRMKYYVDRRRTYTDRDEIYELIKTTGTLDNAEESVYMLCLDPHCRAIGIFECARGSSDRCFVTMKNVFTRAMLCGADSIIIWHNHPSGVVVPSDCDIAMTRQFIDAGRILDIPVLDHLIVTQNTYTSMFHSYPSMPWQTNE